MARWTLAIVALAVSAAPTSSFAQSIVTTPILRAYTSTNIECRVTNRTGGTIAPTVRIKSGNTGGNLQTGTPNIANNATGVVSTTNQSGQVYCEAEFLTNGAADQSRVDLILKDSAGVALSAVRGLRTGSSQGSSVYTPSLSSVEESSFIACYALNTDSVQRELTINLYDDSGALQFANTATVASGTSTGLAASNTVSCQVIAPSGTVATKLRVDITERVDGTGSTSAVEGY
jgi:hypothetical protein